MMKGSDSKDSGGRVVFVDVVVLEIAVVLACLGSTAALTALIQAASAVIVLEKYIFCCIILGHSGKLRMMKWLQKQRRIFFIYAQNKTQSSTVQCDACMTIPCSVCSHISYLRAILGPVRVLCMQVRHKPSLE